MWHSSWKRMRGRWPAEGMRRAEVIDWLTDQRIALGIWEVRPILERAGLWPPPKRYGHFSYQPEHLEAVRAYADGAGLIAQETSNGLAD